jgi:hypothetical protein
MESLRLFSGTDSFGAKVTFPAGSSGCEPGAVPTSDLTVRWDACSDASDHAGPNRFGGINFEQSDLDGRGHRAGPAPGKAGSTALGYSTRRGYLRCAARLHLSGKEHE